MEDPYDCIIIGAGISGLSSARRILQRNPDRKIAVLEASDRVGGRTFSVEVKGPDGQDDIIDLGGQWVSDSQDDVMKLLKEFEIDHYPQTVKGTKVLQLRDDRIGTYATEIPKLPLTQLIQMDRVLKKTENLTKEIDIKDPYSHPKAHELDSITVGAYVRDQTGYDSVYDVMNIAVGSICGADNADISALSYFAYANCSGGMYKQMVVENGGAQQVSQRVIITLQIH